MHITVKAGALALLTAALSAPAIATTIIDNFTTGAQSFQLDGGTGNIENQGDGTVPNIVGGQRDVLLSVTSNPFNRRMGFDVGAGSGMAFLSSGSGVVGFLELDYDGVDVEGNDGVLSRGPGLNLDLSSETDFLFSFAFADSDVRVDLIAETYGPGGASDTVSSSTATLLAGETNTGDSYSVSLGDFGNATNGGVDFSNVDRLVFRFTPQEAATDFALSSIQVVPEPASLAVIGMGIVGILARRRRSKI